MSIGSEVRIAPELSGYYVPAVQGTPAPGVLVLMEAFGLTPHIRRVCERFAAAGFAALAPDIYHGETYSYDSLDQAIGKMRNLQDDALMDEVGASLDWLQRQPGVLAGRLGVSGFCMGGRLAFLAGCRHAARLGAVVGYYGGAIFPEGERDRLGRLPPINEAAALAAPLLLIYGAQDGAIPPAEHGRIAQRLSELDKRYAISVHPGAGHGFCCEDRASHAPQAKEAAHAEAIDFLARTLKR